MKAASTLFTGMLMAYINLRQRRTTRRRTRIMESYTYCHIHNTPLHKFVDSIEHNYLYVLKKGASARDDILENARAQLLTEFAEATADTGFNSFQNLFKQLLSYNNRVIALKALIQARDMGLDVKAKIRQKCGRRKPDHLLVAWTRDRDGYAKRLEALNAQKSDTPMPITELIAEMNRFDKMSISLDMPVSVFAAQYVSYQKTVKKLNNGTAFNRFANK